ncbi:MAG TPA: acyl carrier protein [Thermoleophilaceae bacterium]|jgi:acyl carrier protein
MTDEQIAATLKRLMTQTAGIPEELIQLDSTFEGDLAMDSLSFVAFQVELEQTFKIDCPLEDLYDIVRFDEVVALVRSKLPAEEAVS